MQVSCLRAEQTQLSKTLEKERQRAAEIRQEYLAAKEEADTQEGRVNQLEEEMRELRRKHKEELQESLRHRELLQQVLVLIQTYSPFNLRKYVSSVVEVFMLGAHLGYEHIFDINPPCNTLEHSFT